MAGNPKIGIDIDVNTGAATIQLQNFGDAAQRKMKKTSLGVEKALTGMVAGFASVTLAIDQTVKAVQKIAEFEKAMAEVSTLVDTSVVSMSELEQQAIRLSQQFGTSATDQAKGFYQAISAGASTAAEATALMEAANMLAVGGVTDIGTAIDGLTSVVNAYGVQQKDVSDVADIFFASMKAGKTTVGELSSYIGRIAPTARTAGIGMAELFAAVSAITTGGIRTSEAVTSLNQALVSFIKPNEQAQMTAYRLGVTFSEAELRSRGLAGMIRMLSENERLTNEDMVTLFGSVEAFKAVAALAANDGEKLNKTLEGMAERSGAAAEATEKMEDTISKRMEKLSAAFDAVVLSTKGLESTGVILDELTRSLSGLAAVLQEGGALGAMGELVTWNNFVATSAIGFMGPIEFARQALESYGSAADTAAAKAKKLAEEQAALAAAAPGKMFDMMADVADKAKSQGQLVSPMVINNDELKQTLEAVGKIRKAQDAAAEKAREQHKKDWSTELGDADGMLQTRAEHEKAIQDELRQREIEGLQAYNETWNAMQDAMLAKEMQGLQEYEAQQQQALAQGAQQAQFFASILSSGFMAALSGAKSLGDFLKNMLKQLAAMVLQNAFFMLLMAIMPAGGIFSAGGFLGGLLGFGKKHGGVMGAGGYPLHAANGLMVPNTGTDRDVFPALLRRGEEVITPEDPRNAMNHGGGGGTTVVVNAPMQLLAPPSQAEVARHFAANVVPVLDGIAERGTAGSFKRLLVR